METFELPLFPLNTVLFPSMLLPLHIFEERYKTMVGECLLQQRPFGVVYVKENLPEQDILSDTYRIGCTAYITQMQPLSDGRMNILTVGRERFRILSVKRERPYLVGRVELAPLEQENQEVLFQAATQLFPLVKDYLGILSRVGNIEFDPTHIPRDPEMLAYLAAAIVQIPMEQKQEFLLADRASRLYRNLQGVYRQEVSLLRLLPSQDMGTFSLN